jgi:histidinol-phosphate phosphatase family protein
MSSGNLRIDKSWSLFLDRDGVINRRIVGGYVTSWDRFEFLPGVLDALKILAGNFSRIIVISNQQGVGKGIMTDSEVQAIHARMTEEVRKDGGNIDKIYYCPFLKESESILRKPGIGMALLARKEFPGINFKRSVMVGDSISDMIFGKRLKMKTVFLSDDIALIRKGANMIDFVYNDLLTFATSPTSPTSPISPPSPSNTLAK